MPGFIDFKTFVAPDGERVSLVVFDTRAHHDAWRNDPDRRSAQQRGRDSFYRDYTIAVCCELGRRHFDSTESLHVEAESSCGCSRRSRRVIGTRLLALLAEAGHKVGGMTRSPDNVPTLAISPKDAKIQNLQWR